MALALKEAQECLCQECQESIPPSRERHTKCHALEGRSYILMTISSENCLLGGFSVKLVNKLCYARGLIGRPCSSLAYLMHAHIIKKSEYMHVCCTKPFKINFPQYTEKS